MDKRNFADVLSRIRKKQGFKTQKELADKLGWNRSIISNLESKNRAEQYLPTIRRLRQLCDVLASENVNDRIELISAALGTSLSGLAITTGKIEDEAELQKEEFEEIWVISDILAENVSDSFLKSTIENIGHSNPRKYVYFIPSKSEQFDHLLEQLEAAECLSNKNIEEHVTCITCPEIMFFSRITIKNPGKLSFATGKMSMEEGAKIIDLPHTQVFNIISILIQVEKGLRRKFEKREQELTINARGGNFSLIYPKLTEK